MLSDRHRTRGHCGTGTRHGRHPLVFPLPGQQQCRIALRRRFDRRRTGHG
jgi:hypothetical protein